MVKNMNESSSIPFDVDETSDLPIWVQLKNRISYLIRIGYFATGDQLPSIRTLSADACISYDTVAKAYRDLELGGLIRSMRGKGMFVRPQSSVEDENIREANALFDTCIQQYLTAGMTHKDVRQHILGIIDKLEEATEAANKERREDYGV